MNLDAIEKELARVAEKTVDITGNECINTINITINIYVSDKEDIARVELDKLK